MNRTFRHKTYKVELKPTSEQIQIIERTMGVCRYVYNLFIATNRDNFRNDTANYMSGYDFSKWLNNDYKAVNPDKLWIWLVSSKAVKKAIMNADTAYKNFMKGRSGFPKFKRRNGKPVSMYLPRNNAGDLKAEPVRAEKSSGIGIDLGVKSFAVVSDGREYPNINKSRRMRKLTKRLKHEQRKFMRKIRHRKEDAAAKKCKRSNLDKQRLRVQRAYMRITNKRHDYINKTVHEIVRTQPEYITIEDLNVSGMMKNRHLSRAIVECEFWYFRTLLERKCRELGIQLRIAGRFYASSKTCSVCGHVKKDLKLSDRVYECPECGLVIDRDYNAAINLMNCEKFSTAG